MANNTIDLISIANNVSATSQSKSKNAFGSEFDSVLDSVSSASEKQSADKSSNLEHEKNVDKKNYRDDNKALSEKDEQKKLSNKENESSENKTEEKTDVKNSVEKSASDNQDANKKVENKSDSKPEEVAAKEDAAQKTDSEAKVQEQTSADSSSLSMPSIQLSEEFLEAVKSLTSSTDSQLAKMAQDFLDSQTVQENVSLENVDEKSVDSIANAIKARVENQQTVSNIKIPNQQPSQNQVAQESSISEQTPVDFQSQTVEAPMVEVSEQVVASADEVLANAQNNDIKSAMKNSKLSQEIIDDTKVEIVSVSKVASTSTETSSQNAGGNAQEQAIKLAIEGVSQNVSMSTSDDLAQVNFDKTIETVNVHTPKDISKSDILSQIHTKLTNLSEEGGTKITILLKPENLGKINLELVSTKEGLTAQMTTDNPQVKEALDKSLDGLKESLGSQGINVNSVSVKVEVAKEGQDTAFNFAGQSDKENQGQNGQAKANSNFEQAFGEDDDQIDSLSEIEQVEKTIAVSSSSGKIDYKI